MRGTFINDMASGEAAVVVGGNMVWQGVFADLREDYQQY